MSADKKFKEGLDKCFVCDALLTEAIKERVDAGETVRAVCKDYEEYQRQTKGVVTFGSGTLRTKFYRSHPSAKPQKPIMVSNDTTKSSPKEGFEFRLADEDNLRVTESGEKKLSTGSTEYVSEEGKYRNELAGLLRVFKGNLYRLREEFVDAGFEFPANKVADLLAEIISDL